MNFLKRSWKSGLLYLGIILVTLALVDVVTIALGLFPPTYRYGDPDVGWLGARPTGEMEEVACIEYSTGERFRYTRNEDGVRTSFSAGELREDRGLFTVAVAGDSQTELCAPNPQTHFGVLERELAATGLRTAVYAYGAGKYSPLQAYLATKRSIAAYATDALVLNFYTGNDFYDLLRIDDRPHFVRSPTGYDIAPPIWYQEDPPGLRRRSRVLFAFRTFAQRTGIRTVAVRLRYLRDAAAEQGKGLATVIAYMNDLRKSVAPTVGYQAAYSAQMLNQQLFFQRFPGSREESVRRVQALLELVRKENPGMLLVLSALPSYQLVRQPPVDTALLEVLDRLPLTYDGGVQEEEALYTTLRRLAEEAGWVFVDNLTPLRAYAGEARLFNDFDYHYLPPGSAIIGRAQADAITPHARARVK